MRWIALVVGIGLAFVGNEYHNSGDNFYALSCFVTSIVILGVVK